jgi:hypothetical protein
MGIDESKVINAGQLDKCELIAHSTGAGCVIAADLYRYTIICRSMNQDLGDTERKQSRRRGQVIAFWHIIRAASQQLRHGITS